MRAAIHRDSLEVSGESKNPEIFSILKYIGLYAKYTFLLGILILFAGYESANPKIGTTSIEFFSSNFRSGLHVIFNGADADHFPGSTSDSLVREFFGIRQDMPAWTLNFGVNENYLKLHTLLNSARDYGLIPAQYAIGRLDMLERDMGQTESDDAKLKARIELEITATRAALRFTAHLSAGYRMEDTTALYQAFYSSLPLYLNDLLNENNLRQGILELQPDNHEYRHLQKALYLYLRKAGTDTLEYSLEELKAKSSLAIERLCQQGFLDRSFGSDSLAIRSALKNFQQVHAIEQTGELNETTLIALTLNTKDKFSKIALNLDRLRKAELNSKNCVLVNIPEFRLHYYNTLGESRSFNVVVGKKQTPTPVITSRIQRIIANPFWTVPKSITFNEFIPRIKKDSLYLQKHGYSVIDKFENPVDPSQIDWENVKPGAFNYWIRQPNNGRNALGVVKFVFPNKYSVYLHDTQSKGLFNQTVRAFSHGCVRVQNPEDLAQYILQDYYAGKSGQKIDFKDVVRRKDRVELSLDESVPVYIRYFTCTADTLGTIYFHPDIYKKDVASLEEIEACMSVN
jgi:murein L,D-transpeptidase YcbB/YkuD